MIVRESIGDILKPKSPDDVRKEFKSIIFWKGVIEGKMSPEAIRFFLDQDFVNNKAQEYGLRNPESKWQKQLVYFLYLLDKDTHHDDEIIKELRGFVRGMRNPFSNSSLPEAALYIGLKNNIDRKYKELNNVFKRKMGTNLRND